MRIGTVTGSVTMSQLHPTLAGGRFLMVVPLSAQDLAAGRTPDAEEVVVYDQLGAGPGMRVGFSESGEAAAAFYPDKKPVDGYLALIIDALEIDTGLLPTD